MAYCNSVLSQILNFVPRLEFEKAANRVDGKRRSDALSRWSQFVALAIGQISGRRSLRDIEATFSSQRQHRYHVGHQKISRSALGRANERLDYRFYEQVFNCLYQRCTTQRRGHGFRFKNKLFSLDASLIDVSMKVFPWVKFGRNKSAFKLHIGLDHDGLIPAFACITEGKVSDSDYAKKLALPRGSVLVFDRGYNSYRWHDTLSLQGIFFVSRLRGNAQYRVLERRAVPARGGITSDQTIEYTAARKDGTPLQPIRRVGYRDPDTGKHYVFISNQFQWSAQTIAAIYKQRWQVELFFKWIKQNLKIKAFLGNTENAVMTQIMAALCIYLLLAYLKFQSKFHQSLQQIIRLLQLNLFARRSLQDLLRPADTPDPPSPQLRLALVRN
ncbi:MAG: IS4 family transposase [Proteobacteria bacterium]|nr:IS4 family transposase [Pseudomonadota bacterium]